MCICCCSVAKSYLSTCDPMDCSVAGFPVLHHLPEFAQTHVHWVIQSSHPLSPPSLPALNLSQHQNFSHELALCICNIQHFVCYILLSYFFSWVTVCKNSWNGLVNTLCNFDLLGNLLSIFPVFLAIMIPIYTSKFSTLGWWAIYFKLFLASQNSSQTETSDKLSRFCDSRLNLRYRTAVGRFGLCLSNGLRHPLSHLAAQSLECCVWYLFHLQTLIISWLKLVFLLSFLLF